MNVVELKDIATLFAGRAKLGDIEAEAFVNSMFSVIRQGLEADRQVKIRSFGTFKIIDVEARESVSVNTGERVVIESHRKVTFTPDATMKELVNKPFSLFNTVALNDGVEFDDVDVETSPEAGLQNQNADVENLPVTVVETETPVVEAEEAVADTEEPETETKPAEPIDETSQTETETATVAPEEEACDSDNVAEEAEEEPVGTQEEPVDDGEGLAGDSEEPADAPGSTGDESQGGGVLPSKRRSKALKAVLYCLLTLVLMGASYFVGMHYGRFCTGGSCIFSHEEAASEPAAVAVAAREGASEEGQMGDTVRPAMPDTTEEKAVGQRKEAAGGPEKAAVKGESQDSRAESQDTKSAEVAAMMQMAARYADKDVRVRTGAYCIVGTDRTVTVRQGESLAALSKRELGPGMDCYVETFNGLHPDAALKAGQIVRIPKLMHKKALRRLAQ